MFFTEPPFNIDFPYSAYYGQKCGAILFLMIGLLFRNFLNGTGISFHILGIKYSGVLTLKRFTALGVTRGSLADPRVT
jgi:hypothetical protein